MLIDTYTQVIVVIDNEEKLRQETDCTMKANASNPADLKRKALSSSPNSWASWQSLGMRPSKLNMYVQSVC